MIEACSIYIKKESLNNKNFTKKNQVFHISCVHSSLTFPAKSASTARRSVTYVITDNENALLRDVELWPNFTYGSRFFAVNVQPKNKLQAGFFRLKQKKIVILPKVKIQRFVMNFGFHFQCPPDPDAHVSGCAIFSSIFQTINQTRY